MILLHNIEHRTVNLFRYYIGQTKRMYVGLAQHVTRTSKRQSVHMRMVLVFGECIDIDDDILSTIIVLSFLIDRTYRLVSWLPRDVCETRSFHILFCFRCTWHVKIAPSVGVWWCEILRWNEHVNSEWSVSHRCLIAEIIFGKCLALDLHLFWGWAADREIKNI